MTFGVRKIGFVDIYIYVEIVEKKKLQNSGLLYYVFGL